MSARNDQVFQLSLTEIAFMVAFILMFLLGFLVHKTTQENKELQEKLLAIENAEQKIGDLQQATQALTQALSSGSGESPSEVIISQLMEASNAKVEAERLKKLLEEQEQKITALDEISKAIENLPADQKDEKIQEEIQSALMLASDVRQQAEKASAAEEEKEMLKDNSYLADKVGQVMDDMQKIETMLKPEDGLSELTGQSPVDKVAELIKQAKDHAEVMKNEKTPEVVKKENADLRGQVAFLQNKLGAKGGMDYPPCWADELTGKIEMLLYVELRENDLSVERAWPPGREADAMAMPGMKTVLSKPVTTYADFIRDTKAIADLSRTMNCRYYVKLKSTIADAVQSDRRRLSIEDSFYKYEVRR